jgi:hypothetical protein
VERRGLVCVDVASLDKLDTMRRPGLNVRRRVVSFACGEHASRRIQCVVIANFCGQWDTIDGLFRA